MRPRRTLLWLGLLGLLVGLWAGCVAAIDLEGLPCPQDRDCRRPYLTCDSGSNTCVRKAEDCPICQCENWTEIKSGIEGFHDQIAISSDGRRVAAASSRDKDKISAWVWNEAGALLEESHNLSREAGVVQQIGWHPQRSTLGVLYRDKPEFVFWDLDKFQPQALNLDEQLFHQKGLGCFWLGLKGQRMELQLCNGPSITICGLSASLQANCNQAEPLPATPLAQADGLFTHLSDWPHEPSALAAITSASRLRLWRREGSQYAAPMGFPNATGKAHDANITQLLFAPSGHYLVSLTVVGREVKIWDAYNGIPHKTFKFTNKQPMRAAFSPSGKMLAIAFSGHVEFYETSTWRYIRTLKPSQAGAASYQQLTFVPSTPFRLLVVGRRNSLYTCVPRQNP